MAGYVALRDALVAALAAVPNIGQVFDYQRYIQTATTAKAAFQSTIGGADMIQFADVHLVNVNYQLSSSATVTTWRYDATTTFRVRVFRSLDDASASERAFTLLLEAALQAAVKSMASLTPHFARINARISDHDHREFGFPGIGMALVHYGELLLAFPDQVVV